MQAKVLTSNLQSEYYFDEGCFIVEMANSPDDALVSIARARVLPGATTQWHCLQNTIERYVILSGVGLVEIGDLKPQPVSIGDVAIIPAACRQRIANTGSDDLIFLAICSPRFELNNYQAIDTN